MLALSKQQNWSPDSSWQTQFCHKTEDLQQYNHETGLRLEQKQPHLPAKRANAEAAKATFRACPASGYLLGALAKHPNTGSLPVAYRLGRSGLPVLSFYRTVLPTVQRPHESREPINDVTITACRRFVSPDQRILRVLYGTRCRSMRGATCLRIKIVQLKK